MLAAADGLSKRPPSEHEGARKKLRVKYLAWLRQGRGDPGKEHLLLAYEEAHETVAAGAPPLRLKEADRELGFRAVARHGGGGCSAEAWPA